MSDDGLSAFLNRTGIDLGSGVPLVNPENPVQWGKLGGALIGSIVAMVQLGIIDTWNAIATGVTDLLTGATEFFAGRDPLVRDDSGVPFFSTGQDGLIGVVIDPLTTAARNAWNVQVEQFGLLALPISVGIVMLSLWVLSRTLTEIREGDI